jgi:hypothetical protein
LGCCCKGRRRRRKRQEPHTHTQHLDIVRGTATRTLDVFGRERTQTKQCCSVRFCPFRNLSFACDLTTCLAALATHSTHGKRSERYGSLGMMGPDGTAKKGPKTRKIFLRVFVVCFPIFYDCSLTIPRKKMAVQHFYGSLIFSSNNHKKICLVLFSFSHLLFPL